MSERRYTLQEANDLLRRAGQEPAGPAKNTLSESELRETAAELGVSPEALEAQMAEKEGDREMEAARAEVMAAGRRSFFSQAIGGVLLVGLLLWFALFQNGGPWLLGLAVVRALFLVLQYRAAFHPDRAKLDRKAQRLLTKRRLMETGSRLGRALGRGALALLDEAADAIDGAVDERDKRKRGGP